MRQAHDGMILPVSAKRLPSELNVHREVVVDGGHNAGDKLQEHEESEVMPRLNSLLDPIIYNFLHDKRMLARVDK